MENNRITLQSYLDKYGWLQKGMIVKATLIDELEIYGFINCSEEMLHEFKYNHYDLLGIIDKDPSRQIIQSNYMYQIIEWVDDAKLQNKGVVTPIYSKIQKSDIDIEINIKELYIPDLVNHKLYQEIRSRKGTGVKVTAQMLNKYTYQKDRNLWKKHNIAIKDGEAMMPICKGDILCKHIMDNSIKSIVQKLFVVCRYIHSTTGRMCYTQFELDELTTKDEEYDLF